MAATAGDDGGHGGVHSVAGIALARAGWRERLPARGVRPLDHAAAHQLSPGRGRDQPVSGHSDGVSYGDLRAGFVKSIQHRVKEFFVMLLMLEAGVIGVFLSLDLFLFFVFWEVMLIPMAFLIGIWGHERRVYAAVKFVLYTMAGSILMLVGIIWLYDKTGTFDLPAIHGM